MQVTSLLFSHRRVPFRVLILSVMQTSMTYGLAVSTKLPWDIFSWTGAICRKRGAIVRREGTNLQKGSGQLAGANGEFHKGRAGPICSKGGSDVRRLRQREFGKQHTTWHLLRDSETFGLHHQTQPFRAQER